MLKCIPYLIEDVGRIDKITEIIPQHGISSDPGVREEAWLVLHRIVRYLPQRRYSVMKGMANFILQLPDEYPLLIQTSLGNLVDLMRLWRGCLSEQRLTSDAQIVNPSTDVNDVRQTFSAFSNLGEAVEFNASDMDAIGLIFMSSVDVQIRHAALELLRCVRALRNDIRDLSISEQTDLVLKSEVEPIFVVDVFEEHGVRHASAFLFKNLFLLVAFFWF